MVSASKNIIMSNSMLDLLIEYYMVAYEILEFWKPFREGYEDCIVIFVKMNQFCRCRISSKIFRSNMSSRYIKSSYILAKFIISDNIIKCYPRKVQFFFSHKVNLSNRNRELEYNLAFIQWYQPVSSWYHFNINDDETCNVEL